MEFENVKVRKIFADNLKAILKEQGLSQAELARRIGADDRVISYYIHMQRTPSIVMAKNIADALGVTVNDLIGY